jgi:hypothetical protein
MELNLNCLPNDAIHVSGFCGEDGGIVKLNMVQQLGYVLDHREVGAKRFLSSPQRPGWPLTLLVPGAVSLGVKQRGPQADRSPSSIADVNND